MNFMRSTVWSVLATAALVVVAAVPVRAAELIDNFADWSAFTETAKGGKACWIGSEPAKSEGKYKKRGSAYVLVTHRPKEKAVSVVSITAGYVHKTDSEVALTIGGHAFALFTDGGQAWARDSKTDNALVRAMKGGKTMVVKGTSSRGTPTTDTYSLAGFTAAITAINKACGVK